MISSLSLRSQQGPQEARNILYFGFKDYILVDSLFRNLLTHDVIELVKGNTNISNPKRHVSTSLVGTTAHD